MAREAVWRGADKVDGRCGESSSADDGDGLMQLFARAE